MGTLNFEQLRLVRHWVARSLVAALLFPLLLGLLPQPALSAAAALERDLAWSICDPGAGVPGEHRERDQRHDAQCILCATGCPVGAPALAAAQTSAPLHRAAAQSSVLQPSSDRRSILRVLRDGNPTRGPPLA